VREAAAPYLRVLVRVPEAYWLVRDYKATRPGVLVLDGVGRKVAVRAVTGEAGDVAGLAAELQRARTAEPVADGWPQQVSIAFGAKGDLTAEQREAAAGFAKGLPGVSRAEWSEGGLQVTGARLWLEPAAIETGARLLGVEIASAAHRRATVKVTEVRDTGATLRNVMALERRLPAIVSATPDVARDEIRVLYRGDLADLDAVRAAVAAVGFTLAEDR